MLGVGEGLGLGCLSVKEGAEWSLSSGKMYFTREELEWSESRKVWHRVFVLCFPVLYYRVLCCVVSSFVVFCCLMLSFVALPCLVSSLLFSAHKDGISREREDEYRLKTYLFIEFVGGKLKMHIASHSLCSLFSFLNQIYFDTILF